MAEASSVPGSTTRPRAADADAEWAAFLAEQAPLILQVVRLFSRDADEIQDAFLFVCERLRRDDLRRIRKLREEGPANFATWLRAVVRRLCLDWRRHRDGRFRLPRAVARLPELDREVFRALHLRGLTENEAFHGLKALWPALSREGLSEAARRVARAVDGRFSWLLLVRLRFEQELSPELRPLVKGMERADSVAFDMHKWMSLPYEIGVALVRDPGLHRGAFALTPAYLEHGTRGIAGGDVWFSDYGVELSRGFRALKAWMALKEHGAARFGRIVRRNVAQARALGARVAAEPALELLAPVALNVVCFRYRGGLSDEGALDALNRELLLRLHESGAAAPSYASVREKYALRACITNHRTRDEDLDVLVRESLRLGRELEAEGRPPAPLLETR